MCLLCRRAPGALEGGGEGGGGGADTAPLCVCFAHSPRIGGRELQAHKSLKSLLLSSWEAGAEQPGHLRKAVSLSEGRLGVAQLAE